MTTSAARKDDCLVASWPAGYSCARGIFGHASTETVMVPGFVRSNRQEKPGT